jgi:hypothetical protein
VRIEGFTVTLIVLPELKAPSQFPPALVETFVTVLDIAEPLYVMLTGSDVEPVPVATVNVSGFGLADKPVVPPLPTVRLTVTGRLPFGVLIVTVPVSLPVLDVRFAGDTVICTLVPRFVAASQGEKEFVDVDTLLIVWALPLKVIFTVCD